jgi:hypothetical protein
MIHDVNCRKKSRLLVLSLNSQPSCASILVQRFALPQSILRREKA